MAYTKASASPTAASATPAAVPAPAADPDAAAAPATTTTTTTTAGVTTTTTTVDPDAAAAPATTTAAVAAPATTTPAVAAPVVTTTNDSTTINIAALTTVFVADQLVNVTSEPKKAKVLSGIENEMKTQPTNNYPAQGSTSAQDAAYYMRLKGISIDSTRDATYSLLDDQSTTTSCHERVVDNPNIFDPTAAANQKKTYPTVEDKFPSKDDPFYELDAATPLTTTYQEEAATATEAAAQAALPFVASLAAEPPETEETQPTMISDTFQLNDAQDLLDVVGGQEGGVAATALTLGLKQKNENIE